MRGSTETPRAVLTCRAGSFKELDKRFSFAQFQLLCCSYVTGSILIGIIGIALAGIPLKLPSWPAPLLSLPHPSGTFMKLDLRAATQLGLGEFVFVFFFVDLFDYVGHAGGRL